MDPFVVLKQEHSILLQSLAQGLAKSMTLSEWSSFLQMIEETFENNHHAKEEELIFAAVRPNELIRGGGPMCTFYFDGHICSSSMSMALKEIAKFPDFQAPPPTSSHLPLDQKSGSPLSIPGEDHESGRMLLSLCHFILVKNDLNEDQKISSLKTAMHVYKMIQERHFQREENCFFKMCESLLTAEQIIEIASKMNQYPKINLG